MTFATRAYLLLDNSGFATNSNNGSISQVF